MRAFGSEISADRLPGGELSQRQRDYAIAALENGAQTKEVAKTLRCSRRTIQRTISRYNELKTNASRPRSGRPASLTRRQRRLLIRITRRYPKIQYRALLEEAGRWDTNSTHPQVSKKTVYRALYAIDLRNFRLKRRPKINRATALLRLRFARDYSYLDWKRVVVKFSDECSVARGSGANQEWSFQYPGEKYDHNKVTEKVLHVPSSRWYGQAYG
ncbi:hypothetical protein C7974DRAFT_405027 [Boeremia exigua]|uniref:uncharacterized protein n=1 Tax=Boeremia exigua TaxID=749465 RepID=UPI001E8EEA53|nr:uncharacterized protein C7974DRAFT_405027 [Boeremia exigua]KAH6613018.1 hypothetical protein C7974DRAFT_405027 [Boeremia exigua]